MQGKYQDMADEEIIALTRSGDDKAMDYLLEKYKNMVRQKVRTLFLIGGDRDDLIQEGMIGLYKAVRDYQADRDSSFFTFADLCVSRQMYSAIKASNRKKNIPLNTYVSLYAPVFTENGEEVEKSPLLDNIILQNNINPEELFIDKESKSVIEYELGRRLSSLEKDVLVLYLGDLNYVQIAERLEREPKSVDNALQRIKSKLSQVLEELK